MALTATATTRVVADVIAVLRVRSIMAALRFVRSHSSHLQMAPVHWRDAQRMQLHRFPDISTEPVPSGAAEAADPSIRPRAPIRAAAVPGSAAAQGASIYRAGDVGALDGPPQVTRVFQQSFNRENLEYEVVCLSGAKRDAAIIK